LNALGVGRDIRESQIAGKSGRERAADPLHCPRIDSELFGNDAHTGPPRSRQGLADSFFPVSGQSGAPEAFTLSPDPRKPGTDSFRHHRSLELPSGSRVRMKRASAACAPNGPLFQP